MFRLALILLFATLCSSFDKNINFQKLGSCSEYQIESGYAYRDAFELSKLANNHPLENENLRLRLYVQTTNDAHILLSSTQSPQHDDKAYEIVIGGWGNSESVIRQKKQALETCGKQAAPLLSPLYPTQFDLIQTKDGVLVLNTPGYPDPFLSCNDSTPVDVKYISFSSWGNNAPARWFYDCKSDKEIPILDVNYKDTICVNTKQHSSATIV